MDQLVRGLRAKMNTYLDGQEYAHLKANYGTLKEQTRRERWGVEGQGDGCSGRCAYLYLEYGGCA